MKPLKRELSRKFDRVPVGKSARQSELVETATRFGIVASQWSEATSDPARRASIINYQDSKVGKSRWA